MKPMLEFNRIPPRAEGWPKRRRKKPIKTPEVPRVPSIALPASGNPKHLLPLLDLENLVDHQSEAALRGAKWVSECALV